MNHYTTYNVHLYTQIAPRLQSEDYHEISDLIDEDELCGLLELVTTMYLQRLGSSATSRLIVGAENSGAPERRGYERPFMTRTQSDLLPLLRHFVEDLAARDQEAASKVVNGQPIDLVEELKARVDRNGEDEVS